MSKITARDIVQLKEDIEPLSGIPDSGVPAGAIGVVSYSGDPSVVTVEWMMGHGTTTVASTARANLIVRRSATNMVRGR